MIYLKKILSHYLEIQRQNVHCLLASFDHLFFEHLLNGHLKHENIDWKTLMTLENVLKGTNVADVFQRPQPLKLIGGGR
jgi:hypothetical protein